MEILDNLRELSKTVGKEIHEQVKQQKTCHITFDLFDMVIKNRKQPNV